MGRIDRHCDTDPWRSRMPGPTRWLVRSLLTGPIRVIGAAVVVAGAFPALGAELDFAELRIRASFYSNDLLGPPITGTLTYPGTNAEGTALSASYASLASGNAFAGGDAIRATTTPMSALFNGMSFYVRTNSAAVFTGTSFADAIVFSGLVDAAFTESSFPVSSAIVPLIFGAPVALSVEGFIGTAGAPFAAFLSAGSFRTGPVAVGGTVATPVFGSGFNALTPSGQGELLLVSPLRIDAPGLFHMLAIAEVELHYVPEPGTTALLLWGAGALVWRARVLARRQGALH